MHVSCGLVGKIENKVHYSRERANALGELSLGNIESSRCLMCISLRVFCCFLLLSVSFCSGEVTPRASALPERATKSGENVYANEEMTTRIIPSVDGTFGYDIFVSGRRLIHQPNIPGLAGNRGFTTKSRAQITADFVVKKIRNNEMPPTVTMEDLQSLGVLKEGTQ